jgi:acetyl-CoA C-acetyltransferase
MAESVRDVVICEPVRTPVGRYGGALKDVAPHTLAAGLVRALMDRTGLADHLVDEVILGNCYPTMDAPAIGRVAALDAGLPVTVAGVQIDRRCGSGLQAVIDGVTRVALGAADVVVAGGVESMSRAPRYATGGRFDDVPSDPTAPPLKDALAEGRVTAGGYRYPVPGGMIQTAEQLRADYRVPRERQDQLALRSHERALQAMDSGRFDEEIVAVLTESGPVAKDEHPRRGLTPEKLAGLGTIVATDPESTVTAGNASGQNDGAAVCVITTRELARERGLAPYGRLVGWALAGVEPVRMGLGPVPAVHKVLARAGLTLDQLDLIEINEAFASQVLACTEALEFGDLESSLWQRTNVNGSGISLGHPVGATGARILATMLRELDRREGRYALETMCIGGGQGLAAVFEAVPRE